MKVVLLGSSGQIGFELSRLLPSVCELFVFKSTRVDVAHADEFLDATMRISPDWIINAAAYTQVDNAETDAEIAFAANAELPGVLARTASLLGARLVHFSTDYVFSGTKSSPYLETDPVSPINIYGASKAAGEIAVQNCLDRHLIFRTSWIYSRRRANFLLTMERLIKERDHLSVVCDQTGAPTSAIAVARAVVLAMLKTGASVNKTSAPPWGTYHLTCAGETSWYGFAEAISSHLDGPKAQLKAIHADEFKAAASRPKNSRLSNAKFESTFNFRMPPWRAALDEMYANSELENDC